MTMWIFAATRAEASACRRGIRRGAGPGRDELRVVRTGMGTRASARAFERLRSRATPSLAVSTGFAHATDPRVEIGSWFRARAIHRASDRPGVPARRIETREPDLGRALRAVPAAELVTVDRLHRSGPLPELRRDAATTGNERPLVLLVDMETAALAEIASREEIPFLALRLVTDTPRRPLPPLLDAWTSAATYPATVRARALLTMYAFRETLRHPGDTARLVREGRAWCRRLREGWEGFARELLGGSR